MKKYLSLFIFSIIFTSNTNYAFSISPENFIKSTVEKAALTLSLNISKEERIEKLKEIAKETVDITGLGLYSLGANRKRLSEEKLNDYQIVFKSYFLKSFSSRLAEYSNPEIIVNSQKIINKNYTIVSSTLVGTDTKPEVEINWKVYTKNPENLLVRDLIIEGLSLARTQKEEFLSIINSNDGQVDALIKNLSEFDN